MLKPKFIMLVGLPGSGKTSWAKNRVNDHTVHISSDEIREELYGDAGCQKDPDAVFALMRLRTTEALARGMDVIYDATNITRKNRKSILNVIPAHVTKECIIVWAPINMCIQRDKLRDRTVGEAVIDKMIRRFEAPFYDEGFDTIRVVMPNTFFLETEQKYLEEALAALDISHDNPHHSASVLEHCQNAAEAIKTSNVPYVVKLAGLLHDIGKPYTKTFVNKKGEITEIAHYYDHQAVGAWISYGTEWHSPTLAWLISTHMAPFINKKYYESLDPYYKYWIDELHKADVAAH